MRGLNDPRRRRVLNIRLTYNRRRGYLYPSEYVDLQESLDQGAPVIDIEAARRRLVRPRFWRTMLVRVVFAALIIGGMFVLSHLSK